MKSLALLALFVFVVHPWLFMIADPWLWGRWRTTHLLYIPCGVFRHIAPPQRR